MESIKEIIYGLPPPPARIRKKQLQVICVGPPRSATMSLAVALRELGLETYHDQNLVAEANPAYTHQWDLLTRKKLYGAPSGTHISVTEFDAIIGHIEAFVGIGAYTFAVEIMEAYPDAKVILNTRKDLDAWHRSIMKAVSNVLESRVLRTLRFFNTDLFWSWELLFTHMLQGLSRSPSVKAGILYNGKSAYQEHCDMIRSVTPQDRLLEWSVEDGWEPLCKFLDKPLPCGPFPRTNDGAAFSRNIATVAQVRVKKAIRNMVLLLGSLVALATAIGFKIKQREQ